MVLLGCVVCSVAMPVLFVLLGYRKYEGYPPAGLLMCFCLFHLLLAPSRRVASCDVHCPSDLFDLGVAFCSKIITASGWVFNSPFTKMRRFLRSETFCIEMKK